MRTTITLTVITTTLHTATKAPIKRDATMADLYVQILPVMALCFIYEQNTTSVHISRCKTLLVKLKCGLNCCTLLSICRA